MSQSYVSAVRSEDIVIVFKWSEAWWLAERRLRGAFEPLTAYFADDSRPRLRRNRPGRIIRQRAMAVDIERLNTRIPEMTQRVRRKHQPGAELANRLPVKKLGRLIQFRAIFLIQHLLSSVDSDTCQYLNLRC
jgi:hypothetical protein